MSSADFDQARSYINLLRGDANAKVHWQMFNDDDTDAGPPQVFYSTLDDAINRIKTWQRKGYGAYVTINPTDGKGRKVENITGYNWLFADIDGDGQRVLQKYPLKPAFITSRDKTHGHVYWPVTGITSEKQYNYVQKRIAMYLGSDTQVIDPARVARCPGTLHLKDPSNPTSYTIVQDNSAEVDFEYDYDEVIAAFKVTEKQQKELDKFVSNREALSSGSGLNENPIYREQLRNFAEQNAIPAVKGEGRSKELFRVAGFGYDRGVTVEETIDILWEVYNPRCDPPWTEKEYPNFVSYCERAYRYGKNAPGCKTATGIEWGDVAEPTGGWDKNQAIGTENKKTGRYDKDMPDMEFEESFGDIGFITKEQAATNSTMITSKSTVYEHGLKFIGENFPNKTLLRYESVFYVFNGKHWDEVSDEHMMSLIMRFFACWLFPPSKIKNIFDTVKMQVFEDNLKRGVYLNEKENEMITSIIVKNGIIDIKEGKAVLTPHDRNFFDLNMMPYDYDPTATCDDFLKFVDQQWPGDKEMHDQLQEMYGLCLMPVKQIQLFALMIGKSRSGKGVHREIITEMIGKHNVVSPSLENLIEDHTINAMSKAKVAIVPEANAINHLIKDRCLNRVKAITGGDSIHFNRKFKDSAECDVWPFMIIQANELPDFVDASGALANRVWPFRLKHTFAGKEDKGLADRLCAPKSISGIFNWALEGLVRVLANNMSVTFAEDSKRYVEDVRYDTFPLASFFEDSCIIDPSTWIYVDDLHQAYLHHAREKGVKMPMSMIKFSKMIDSSQLSITKIRETKSTDGSKRKYYFKGVQINDIAKQKANVFPPTKPPININKNIK